MCGRYVPPDEAALDRFWRIDRRNWRGWIKPAFNIAPTAQVPILRRAADGAVELVGARWGLIPSWWKKDVPPNLTFNARSEEAAHKPTWRQGMAAQRCLMPARGWYEWKEDELVKSASGRMVRQPYFIQAQDTEVIAFAGLWATWEAPGATTVLSCALLSREAAPAIAAVHHRMPVVLHAADYDAWLDPATPAPEVARCIAQARGDFTTWRVSTAVNNARHDGPELLEPL